MTDQFFPLRYEEMHGAASRDLTGREAREQYELTKPIVDYVAGLIYGLADHPEGDQLSALAGMTRDIVQSGQSELWFVTERDMEAYACAAMIFVSYKEVEAYPAIALNYDRLVPFDRESLPNEAKDEIGIAIIDLPATKRLIEKRGIRLLSPDEFLRKLTANPHLQRVVPFRKWLKENGFMDQLAGR